MGTTKPKRKKTTTVVEEVPAEEFDIESSQGPTELDFSLEEVRNHEELQTVMEQFPEAGITAKLYDGSGAFCYRLPDPQSIDEEIIRKRCGSGKFVIRIYVSGVYKHSIPLAIRQLSSPEERSAGSLTPDRHSDFLEKLCLQLAENKSASTGPSLADLTGALANLDSLRGKQESALDIFQKGLDFAQSVSGQTDWKTDLIRTAKDAIPTIKEMVMGVKGMPAQANTPTQALPQPEMIKQGLAYMKKKAIGGMDPGLVVDWVVNNAEEYQGLIHAVLTTPFEEFVKIDAEIGTEPFKQWFRTIFDGLRQSFTPVNSMDVDSGGNVGDEINPGNNGKPSSGGSAKS